MWTDRILLSPASTSVSSGYCLNNLMAFSALGILVFGGIGGGDWGVGVVAVGAQEPLLQDDMLEPDVSPPLSAEDGLTILGTGAVDVASTLSCHRRLYSYRVTKTDSAGRKCWGQVNVMSCWGRCDSNEIPDFRFPYKKSHHPVCIFGSRKPNMAVLDNCDEGVEPGTDRYEYQEAETCQCSVCKSSEASCEGMRYRGVRSGY